jgi:serine/threonine protein kinase
MLAEAALSTLASDGPRAWTPLDPAGFGRHVVLSRLGAGGMGVVYLAYDPVLERKVAIKVLRAAPDLACQRRLLREARAMARVAHPHLIAVHDVGVHEGQAFLVMECHEGGTLRQWLCAARRGWREVREMFVQVARGLAAAHEQGVVHRDVKPENVLLARDGRAVVTDLGLALVPGSPAEAACASVYLGTPAYMSPEQLRGHEADARSDQFGFCVALHEGLYGVRPFVPPERGDGLSGADALALEIIHARVRPPPPDRDVPAWLRERLLVGLRPDPEERYASMLELVAALTDEPRRGYSSRK